MDTERNICVFGASSSNIDEAYFADARAVGRLIAEAGFGMVFGAGDHGLMGAAARGCFEAGGRVIGVIPEKLNKKGVYFENCTEKIVTPTMHERKAVMEHLSCGFIALGGGFGTLEEFMEVLTLKQLSYMDPALVLLNTRGYYAPLIAQLENCVSEGFTNGEFSALYRVASSPAEAVSYCVEYKGMAIRDKLMDALNDRNERA
ncbi:MAG: TIGR00730 family Rossman fold protein [Clostridiales bacterium]|nr:TIGR00730 family Rossman fold protein [Clostridiales bacterium]